MAHFAGNPRWDEPLYMYIHIFLNFVFHFCFWVLIFLFLVLIFLFLVVSVTIMRHPLLTSIVDVLICVPIGCRARGGGGLSPQGWGGIGGPWAPKSTGPRHHSRHTLLQSVVCQPPPSTTSQITRGGTSPRYEFRRRLFKCHPPSPAHMRCSVFAGPGR